MRPRIVLLATRHSYRTPAFSSAAQRLDVDLITVLDVPAPLIDSRPDSLGVPFREPEHALGALLRLAEEAPVAAILAVDDSGALLAAEASAALGLPHNTPAAAEAARDKLLMRRLLNAGGVPSPRFRSFTTDDDPDQIAQQVSYPCVMKPTRRSGSQGVIRANDPAELSNAFRRIAKLLQRVDAGVGPPWALLVEEYIPGLEVALEGLLDDGELHVLALFDKPHPLEGPYFEETIYTTPSRLPAAEQQIIVRRTAQSARALGLRLGPVHAELRLNQEDAWIVEIAGRSIGGLCSRTLRFGVDTPLEELVLRQAAGLPIQSFRREAGARGVMMIPIPAAGILRRVTGVDEARTVPGIEDVVITVPLHNTVTPLPEGDSYLGFIFARNGEPAMVEEALRQAHRALRFDIEPVFNLSMMTSESTVQDNAPFTRAAEEPL